MLAVCSGQHNAPSKCESFFALALGAFIDIDNSKPRLSGLCHRSEVAEKRVEDVRKLYSEGDVVKAKVLKLDMESTLLLSRFTKTGGDGATLPGSDEVAQVVKAEGGSGGA